MANGGSSSERRGTRRPHRIIGMPITCDGGVTTVILSYNSEDFLPSAIESALCQEISRPHQIWIHDDASTDGSQEIIESFVRRNPERIVGFVQQSNLFSQRIRIRNVIYDRVKTGYIASLDGDDYWTDAKKLQKQCDLLDQNPTASLSVHSWRRVDVDGAYVDTLRVPGRFRKHLQYQSFLVDNPVCSATAVIRASAFQDLSGWNANVPTSQDWELWAMLAEVGDVVCVDEVMADFRFYASQTALTIPPALHHDQQLIREALLARSRGMNRARAYLATTAGWIVDRLGQRYSADAKVLLDMTKVLVEASAGNLKVRSGSELP